MLARPFAIWLLVGSLAAPAWAQAQRGTLEGSRHGRGRVGIAGRRGRRPVRPHVTHGLNRQ